MFFKQFKSRNCLIVCEYKNIILTIVLHSYVLQKCNFCLEHSGMPPNRKVRGCLRVTPSKPSTAPLIPFLFGAINQPMPSRVLLAKCPSFYLPFYSGNDCSFKNENSVMWCVSTVSCDQKACPRLPLVTLCRSLSWACLATIPLEVIFLRRYIYEPGLIFWLPSKTVFFADVLTCHLFSEINVNWYGSWWWLGVVVQNLLCCWQDLSNHQTQHNRNSP